MSSLCACGCGRSPKTPGAKFISGHNSKKYEPGVNRQMRFRISGRDVYPQKGWTRKNGWGEADSVKACVICGEPIWRSFFDGIEAWQARVVHAGDCRTEYYAQKKAAEKKTQKTQLNEKQRATLDKEQLKIDSTVAMRLHTRPFDAPHATRFFPQIAWLF